MRGVQTALLVIMIGMASAASAASDQENRETFFKEFCLNPGTPQKAVDALQRSAKMGAPNITEIAGTRYILFPIKGLERAGVTIINPSVGGLWCSVGIKNVGINLYTNGRVDRE